MNTVPIIRQVLHYKVGQWCELICGDIPQIPTDTTGKTIWLTVEIQADIGWDNFIKGHAAKHWSWAQKSYKSALPMTKIFDSNQWTTKLVKALWTIFVDIWNARNAYLHTEMEDMRSSVTDKQIRKAYTLQQSMFHSNHLLFNVSLTDHLNSLQE
eukprot:9978302-Ditylum_brightwellii.AAC.1